MSFLLMISRLWFVYQLNRRNLTLIWPSFSILCIEFPALTLFANEIKTSIFFIYSIYPKIDQWLDQPIKLSVDECMQSIDARVYSTKANTAQLLSEFNEVYDAVGSIHLTPPQTPPESPHTPPLQANLCKPNVSESLVNTFKWLAILIKFQFSSFYWSDYPINILFRASKWAMATTRSHQSINIVQSISIGSYTSHQHGPRSNSQCISIKFGCWFGRNGSFGTI